MVAPVSNPPTKQLAPSSSCHSLNKTEITETELCTINNSSSQLQLPQQPRPSAPQTSPKKQPTNGANNNPTSSNEENITANMPAKQKKTTKESIESKRERKAAKTLAIITGMTFVQLPLFLLPISL